MNKVYLIVTIGFIASFGLAGTATYKMWSDARDKAQIVPCAPCSAKASISPYQFVRFESGEYFVSHDGENWFSPDTALFNQCY